MSPLLLDPTPRHRRPSPLVEWSRQSLPARRPWPRIAGWAVVVGVAALGFGAGLAWIAFVLHGAVA